MSIVVSTHKQIKERLILKDYILTVEGYIRLQTVLRIPQQIVDVALFMYAKPNILNVTLTNEYEGYTYRGHLTFCPIIENITWDSIQMKIRTTPPSQSRTMSFVSSLKSEDQSVTICNCVESSLLNEKEMFEATVVRAEDDPFEYLENVGNLLFKDLSRFLRTLPSLSKTHIWRHSVCHKVDGKKRILEETTKERHVERLICTCVIVFIKYLDRQRQGLGTRRVQAFVKEVVSYIYNTYDPLQRDEFENDKKYLAEMLTDYVENQLCMNPQIDASADRLDKLHQITATNLGNLLKVGNCKETWISICQMDGNASDQIEPHQVFTILLWLARLYHSIKFDIGTYTDTNITDKQPLAPIAEWIVEKKMNSEPVAKDEFKEEFGNWLLQYDVKRCYYYD
eukprot:359685_1